MEQMERFLNELLGQQIGENEPEENLNSSDVILVEDYDREVYSPPPPKRHLSPAK